MHMSSEKNTPERDWLQDISTSTVGHYEHNAVSFREGTWDHDVSQNRKALLSALAQHDSPHILDFGCGPGRDLVAFQKDGAQVTGLDGSATFCAMAEVASGAPVLHQDFLALELPDSHFDGIFANATLFHIPSREIARVLKELGCALTEGGVLFVSNPRGQNDEGWNGERYGSYYHPDTWKNIVEEAGFTLIEEYYRPPGRPRSEQPWFATVWRKGSGPRN